MKYLRYFKKDIDYQNYFESDDFVTPNISYAEDTDIVYYNAPILGPRQLLDIVYYDGSLLRTIRPSQYNVSLGIAVGVIVIPSGILPDGKARFVALQNASS